jgi:uncharacterized protein Yka (UPF0111/DUF47 family)
LSDELAASRIQVEADMSERTSSVFGRFIDRIFPTMPDFFGVLAEQSAHVSQAVGLLVTLMETGDGDAGPQIKREEHVGDKLKARNLRLLNESFATPVDREDIHRAIMNLDEIINYCKTTVYEMEVFAVEPDRYLSEMARHLQEGAQALAAGYGKLKKTPHLAAEDAMRARKAERNVEWVYRTALGHLFEGTNYNDMFKRREIYRHMSNVADRVANCADVLDDIVVKIG